MAEISNPAAVNNKQDRHDVVGVRPPRRNQTFRILVYIVLMLAALIYILPFVWMATKSVMNLLEAHSTTLIPSEIHLENYSQVLGEANFGQYFWNTVRIAFLTVTGQTIVSILAAYAFARIRFPGREVLFYVFLLTLFVPDTILLVPNVVTVTRISQFFEGINPALRWINNWPALVVPFLSSTFGIFLLRQFFKQIPDELWDAAQIDGAGHLRFLIQVVVPISQAAVLTTVLFAFIGTWNALQWPLLVTSDNSWRPIAVGLQQFRSADAADQTQLLMAASVIAMLPVLLLYFLAQRQFREGIATTGLKG
ncbi:MAG: carbohydrate ABC transporter permease [Chloroflexota bacterium]